MDDSNSYTASDLIYLYLDGEADSLQQSMLFGTLARNSELQAEFTEALRIRDAIEQERAAVAPPAHLTDDLFLKAGFSSAGSRVAATASAMPGLFHRLFSRFGAPVLSAAGSALLTAILLTQVYQQDYDELAGELERMNNDRPAVARGIEGSTAAAGPGEPANVRMGQSPSDAGAPAATPPAAGKAAGDKVQEVRRSQPSQSASGSLPPAYDAARTNERNDGRGRAPVADHIAPVSTDAPPETAIPEKTVEEVRLRTEQRADPIASRNPLEESDLRSQARPIEYDSPLDPSAADEPTYRFALQLRGITDVGFYPLRTADKEAQPWYNNMSIGALYQLSRHHAVGLEAGQELFPLYRFDGVTSRLEPRLAWVGGIYRFETGAIEPLGTLRPFVQTTLGGTSSGPIAKGIAGFSYTPDSRVDLSLGLEGTALLYQLHGDWYSTRKMGLTYLMNVHF